MTCYGQGTISFNNSSTSLIQWVEPSTGSLEALPKGQGYVQLFYALHNTPYTPFLYSPGFVRMNPSWTLGPVVPIFPVDGRFNGGVMNLAGVPVGFDADYVIMGWSGNATTFEDALLSGALVGVSGKLSITTSGYITPPFSISDSFGGLVLSQIPEPTFTSLTILGALMLFAWRRP